MPAIVTCPSCNATLKPKTPLPAGARVKCPKCQNVFVVPADEDEAPEPKPAAAAPAPKPKPKPAPPPEEEEDEEGAEAAEGADEAVEDGGKKRVRRPKKKGVPLWVWLVSGGGVLLLGCCGVCGVGGYMAYNTVASAGSGSVTLLNYAKIQKGMSEAQVKSILGEPTVRFDVMGNKTVTWKDGNNTITVIFMGDKATDRSCQLFTSGGTKIDQSGFVGQ